LRLTIVLAVLDASESLETRIIEYAKRLPRLKQGGHFDGRNHGNEEEKGLK
jgi:hypothetical protein